MNFGFMPTIFITISRGSIARNFIHSGVIKMLGERGMRLVILSPAWNDRDFRETVSAHGATTIRFEPLHSVTWTVLDRLLVGIHKALVFNAGTELRDRYGIYDRSETNQLRRIVKKIIFKPLRNIGVLKELVRACDLRLLPENRYDDLFASEKPSLVFSTNSIEDTDVAVLKAARVHGVPIVAMPKSWDNLPKISFRVKPNRLLLWGSMFVKQALQYQNMKPEQVGVVGVPQFDIFSEPGIIVPREVFLRTIGADPDRALIVFGSEGKVTPTDSDIAEIIRLFIEKDELGRTAQLYLRPYFSLKEEEQKFEKFIGKKHVIVDRWFNPCAIFRDRWDYSQRHAIHFANLMAHMDIMINTSSTLTLDAAFLDKPVVNIAFDGFQTKPYGSSVRRLYDSAHFAPIAALEGGWRVNNADELQKALSSYLANPSLYATGRARLRELCCPRLAQTSASLIVQEIMKMLQTTGVASVN